jgi:hypothetical protein
MNMDVAAAEVSASKKFFKSHLSLSVPMSCRNVGTRAPTILGFWQEPQSRESIVTTIYYCPSDTCTF